jgi:hypothetical protein
MYFGKKRNTCHRKTRKHVKKQLPCTPRKEPRREATPSRNVSLLWSQARVDEKASGGRRGVGKESAGKEHAAYALASGETYECLRNIKEAKERMKLRWKIERLGRVACRYIRCGR